jgi:hypothetical protein
MVWREGLVPWAIFLLSAAVIIYAGAKLAHYGDEIAKLPTEVADSVAQRVRRRPWTRFIGRFREAYVLQNQRV